MQHFFPIYTHDFNNTKYTKCTSKTYIFSYNKLKIFSFTIFWRINQSVPPITPTSINNKIELLLKKKLSNSSAELCDSHLIYIFLDRYVHMCVCMHDTNANQRRQVKWLMNWKHHNQVICIHIKYVCTRIYDTHIYIYSFKYICTYVNLNMHTGNLLLNMQLNWTRQTSTTTTINNNAVTWGNEREDSAGDWNFRVGTGWSITIYSFIICKLCHKLF